MDCNRRPLGGLGLGGVRAVERIGGVGQFGGMGQFGGVGQFGGMGQFRCMGQLGRVGQFGGVGQFPGADDGELSDERPAAIRTNWLRRLAMWLGILVVSGLLAATLVRMAPGFGMDERLLDARLSAGDAGRRSRRSGRSTEMCSGITRIIWRGSREGTSAGRSRWAGR